MIVEILECKIEWNYLNILVLFVLLKLRILKSGIVIKCVINYMK